VANIIPENEFLRNHASHGIVSLQFTGFLWLIFEFLASSLKEKLQIFEFYIDKFSGYFLANLTSRIN